MRQHVNPLKRELQVWEHVLLAALYSLPSSLPRWRSVVMHSPACVVFPDGSTLAHYSLSCRWMSVTLLPNSPPPACWGVCKGDRARLSLRCCPPQISTDAPEWSRGGRCTTSCVLSVVS